MERIVLCMVKELLELHSSFSSRSNQVIKQVKTSPERPKAR